jgi:SAM-dependent methyltransferase
VNLARRLFYTIWYFRAPPWDTNISPPELIAFLQSNPPGRAIDLGCGTGTNAITLAQHGWQVIGIDFIGKAIRKARSKARQQGLKIDFLVGDVTRLEKISGLFDLVLDIGCFHNLPPAAKLKYVQNLERFLAPKGTFLLYGFTSADPESETGITPNDLEMIQDLIPLVSRNDGTDRGQRPSAWFTFIAKSTK